MPSKSKLLTEAEITKMPKSEYMNAAQLKFFRERLLELQRQLRENAGATTEHLRELSFAPELGGLWRSRPVRHIPIALNVLKGEMSLVGPRAASPGEMSPRQRRIRRDRPRSIRLHDVDAGQEIFLSTKAACYSCHRAAGRGGNVGPDLSKIGKIRTRAELLESLIYPSLTIIPVKVLGNLDKWNPASWKTDAFYRNPLTGFSVP